MNEISTRTLPIIATEINSIKDQTKKLILNNSIEIGRRLVEAKALVEHGEWGNWLKTKVDFSQSTANNLMRIFEEYGSQQIALFGDNSKSQALGNLSYTQAVALLGMPAEERENFIEENEMDHMSTRELQKKIQELKAANERTEAAAETLAQAYQKEQKKAAAAKELEEQNQELRQANKKLASNLEKSRADAREKVEFLEEQLQQAKDNGADSGSEKVKQLAADLEQAKAQVQELTDKLNQPLTVESAVIEKIPEEIEQELEQLRKNDPAIMKYSVYFQELVGGFQNLLSALSEIKDQEVHKKYKGAVVGLLDKMLGSLE